MKYLLVQNGGVFEFELNERETRYFLFFSEIWWFDVMQLFSFSSHNISSSDLEERDENQEIEKAKVSGGRSVSGSFILLI